MGSKEFSLSHLSLADWPYTLLASSEANHWRPVAPGRVFERLRRSMTNQIWKLYGKPVSDSFPNSWPSHRRSLAASRLRCRGSALPDHRCYGSGITQRFFDGVCLPQVEGVCDCSWIGKPAK